MERVSTHFLSAMLLLSVSFFPLQGSAETVNCTPVTSLPATINSQGLYCLTGNLSTSQSSGIAITINANNVTLDLNGWKVGGQAAGAGTTAYGIYSTANNVTILNGIVRGFYIGIYLSGSGVVVHDMLVDQNTSIGIDTGGQGTLLEHNQVVSTGGTTTGGNVYGIYMGGPGSRAINNDIANTVRNSANTSAAFGLRTTGSPSFVENNRVSDSVDYGIYSSNNLDVTLVGNQINNYAYTGVIGLRTNTGPSIYKDNLVTGFTTGFSASVDGGGNVSD